MAGLALSWGRAARTAFVGAFVAVWIVPATGVVMAPRAAAQSLVSACTGVSLPRSVVTDIMAPVITGVVAPIEGNVNGLLGALAFLLPGLPTLGIDVSGLLTSAAGGGPITLQVIDINGNVVDPSTDCISTQDIIALDQDKGISFGGNRITGLGITGQQADAGELNSIAIGNNATTAATAAGSIAVGRGARVLAGATGSIALGDGATAGSANSVALGAGSTTSGALGAAYNPGTGVLAGATPDGEVSLGSASIKRRLTNVAAGSADTDAANVGQLKALDELVIKYDSTARTTATLGGGVGGTRLTNLTAGTVSSTSTDAVNGAQLFGVAQSIANTLGGGATVDVNGQIVGPTFTVQGANFTTVHSAFGAIDTELTNINTVVNGIGTTVTELGDRAVRYDGAQGAAKDTITLAGGAGGTRITNLTAGTLSAVSTDAVNGSQLFATNQNVAALDNLAVKYDTDLAGNKVNSVSLVGGDPNTPVVLKNVGRGVDDTDAVNVEQLRDGLDQTLVLANTYTDNSLANISFDNRAYADMVGVRTLRAANDYTDMRFGQLASEIADVHGEARIAAAVGLAASALRFDPTPGKVSFSMAGGYWRGSGATAFGLGYTDLDSRFRFNFSGVYAGGNLGASLGVGLTLN